MNTSANISRRRFMAGCTGGASAAAIGLYGRLSLAAEVFGGHPLAPRPTHFPPRANRLLFIFLTGGFSHVDTFDHKPRLATDSGRELSTHQLRAAQSGKLMPSPFKFHHRGQSGLVMSELFPRLGTVADDLCVIRTMHTDIVEHFQATLAMHTGSSTVPLPSIGAWLSYALGTHNPNLPSYVVLAEHLPYAGAQVYDCNFLPPEHQGVRIVPGDEPIPDLKPPTRSVAIAELERMMLRDINELHAHGRADDLDLPARTASFDTARGMMQAAPEVFDLARESAATLDLYGAKQGDNRSFPSQCLVARRLLERGVRVVELIDTGSHDNWDAHGDMQDHRPKALRVDRALSGLLQDLKQRGLLDDTLVAICTEFGRTPTTFNGKGREHYIDAFSCLLAGGGVRGGMAYGETDEYGMQIVKDPSHVHDYHATIMHLLGLDHKRVTYRYAGRDFRLTDVAGRVLESVLA
ncbi:MAG: DUF1501 domain-containing protein [Planctomycetia bacterium]|nr:DUF1501 domain-containing protein [Planctomycetia bacterium]